MRKSLFFITLLFLVSYIFSSCISVSISNINDVEGGIDFYLLESYSTNVNSQQIDESSIILKSEPLIEYNELKSYDDSNHTFDITSKAYHALKDKPNSINNQAFAVTIDGKEIIYTGYFWPSFSSASCDCIVIDPLFTGSSSKMKVKLGYPSSSFAHYAEDKRNDERLLEIFRRDNKLD